MRNFLARHPFIDRQIKLVVTIFIGWNAFVVAAFTPLVALFVILAIIGSGLPEDATNTWEPVYGTGTQQLLSIKVNGVIMGDASDTSPFAGISDAQTFGYDIKQKLYDAAEDTQIKGVVLEINSPGGTIYGSRAIADGVKYYRDKTHQPIYAYIQGQGASGGYWAASATDRIIADHGSDVGSIGVIMGPFKYYNKPLSETGGLFDGGIVTQNGIETVTLSAGKSKDLGSPYRRLTPEEIQVLQTQINNDYDDFVKAVSASRHIPELAIRNQIGAMSYGNKTAQELKLIDQSGSREEAYDALAAAAKIPDDYHVVREQAPMGFVASLLSAISGKPSRQAASPEQLARSLCAATQSRLAYSGSISTLCP